MWDFNEVNELQISEEFVAMMQSLVDHMQEQYHRYFEPVSKLSIMDGIIVKPEVFQWAYLTAIARGVPMKSKTGDVSYGIVPGIDWVNHAYDNNAHLDFSMQGRMLGSMTLRATRDIAAGEQIVRNYVPMPNNQLLLRFGFAIRDNPHDFVSVFLDQAVGATQMAARRKAILRRHQLDADFTEFSLLDTKKKYFHPDLLAAVRVVLANPQELRRIEQYQEKHGKLVCKTSKLSMRNEIDVLEFLGEKIIAARSYQWTTLEEDIATLDRSGSSLAPRLRHALIFRIGQKEIYARALEIILEQRHDLLIKYNEYKKNKKPSADDGAALDSDSDSSSPAVDERKPVENDSPAAATARLIDELQQKKKAAKKAKSKPAGDRTEL
ncbi:hypothetical protein CAOG_002820 [Capsaspora owczarzaki ATCC 30864]|uniref:SET domain-containing protein n=1 Tax=Capsaspora owczarzaki (strain ATCC 30864) TaxID=595528 RepID=A0A0D2WLZ3_CAPO3|nr:hypothetical protein CAOG_002820 [Capsaspora owczarzaki ATCC 30864]